MDLNRLIKRRFNFAGLLIILAVLMASQPVHAATVYNLVSLAPPEFASTTSLDVAFAPNGSLWMSNGQSILSIAGDGSPAVMTSVVQSGGGPVANNQVTTGIAFDGSGNIYINDFGSGTIYRRPYDGGSWEVFASGFVHPRSMRFIGDDLIVAQGSLDGGSDGVIYSVDTSGVKSVIATGLPNIEALAFDGSGNILFADIYADDIYRVSPRGDVTMIFNLDFFGYTESIAVTPGGNILLGVNTGVDEDFNNTSQLLRITMATGVVDLLDIEFNGVIPVGLQFGPGTLSGDLFVSGFGSIHAIEVTGNFDAPTGIPCPSSASAILLAVPFILKRRR